jgi:hypothetical protein
MKTTVIKPITAYANGKRMTATQFTVISIQDNLFDHVTFKYTLLDENGVFAGESTFSLEGLEQYKKWDTTPEGAFQIVANGIGLEIVKDENKTLFIQL